MADQYKNNQNQGQNKGQGGQGQGGGQGGQGGRTQQQPGKPFDPNQKDKNTDR